MLQEALVALIEERGYERLTVQDVLDRADIGRSTFYTHFRDKDALFMTWFDGLREDLRSEFDAMTDSRAADSRQPAARGDLRPCVPESAGLPRRLRPPGRQRLHPPDAAAALRAAARAPVHG
nr:hypothetical protein GCM10020092_083800 [Actinoplanes digitatis]